MSDSKPSPDYLAALRKRYQAARKKQRSVILDELVKTTGYHRKHASALLTGKRLHRKGPIRRPRARVYAQEDERAVVRLAEIFDQISSQRLRVAMDATLPILRRQGHLRVSTQGYAHLQRISPATMDRIRSAHRSPGGRHRGFTKPGTLLKRQIPIRTFADWDGARPGFVEIDLVDHTGGNPEGEPAPVRRVRPNLECHGCPHRVDPGPRVPGDRNGSCAHQSPEVRLSRPPDHSWAPARAPARH